MPFLIVCLQLFRVNVGVSGKLLGISVKVLEFLISPFPAHEVFCEVMCI